MTREELKNLTEEELDEAVHVAKGAEAAEINNTSREAQIQYLLGTAEIEVYLIDDRHGWDSSLVEVPIEVVRKESQDAFLKWVRSDEGKKFRDSWGPDVISVFVCSWEGR